MNTANIALLLLLFSCSAFSRPLATSKQDVISFLKSLNDNHYTLSGQHEFLNNPGTYVQFVKDNTGQIPAWWGNDFGYFSNPQQMRQDMTNYAIQMWNQGSLVHLSWHMCRPDWGDANCCYAQGDSSNCNGNNGITGSYGTVSEDQWQQLMNKNGDYWNMYTAILDNAIPFLQQMISAGVVPIFRLHHEINQGWAWWQSPKYSGKLWQNGIEYIESRVGQNRIVWHWNIQDDTTNDWSLYYPPDMSYMDICGLDIWDEDPGCGGMPDVPSQNFYDMMRQHCPTQPIGLGEVGKLPTVNILKSQSWAWFMVWSDFVYDCGNGEGENPLQHVQEIYQNASGNIFNQGDFIITPVTPPPPGSNLAKNRPCFSSSNDANNRTCTAAFDGDFTTRWSSLYTDDNWIYVDLGNQIQINSVVLFWENAFAKGFQIQTSSDQQTWTTQYENDSGVGGTTTVPLKITTRWVKIYAYARATQYGYSLWEFQIY